MRITALALTLVLGATLGAQGPVAPQAVAFDAARAGATVGEVLDAAVRLHGQRLAAVLPTAAVWVDGEPAERGDPVAEEAEVAILPPVSGGFTPLA